MKYLLALAALFAFIGFVGVSHAAEPKAPKAKPGHFVKVDGKTVTYKGGAKGTGKEYTVQIDDNTKITLDGKDAKIEDIKADMYIEVAALKDKPAISIAAYTVQPQKGSTSKPAKSDSSKDATK